MKKFCKFTMYIVLAIAVALSFSLPILALGPISTDDNVVPLSNEPHVYSITSADPVWSTLTLDERVSACSVSATEVERMSTAALVETVVNYPFIINIFAYDSIEYGVRRVSSYFAGLPELLERSDAADGLQAFLNESATLRSGNCSFSDVCASSLLSFIHNKNGSESTGSTRAVTEYVYTPNGTPVVALRGLTWQDHRNGAAMEELFRIQYLSTYPSTAIISGMDPSYNCFSYAFYQLPPSVLDNNYWINDPLIFIADGSYVYTTNPSHNSRVGYYWVDDSTENVFIEHAGIVQGPIMGEGYITVYSKWGTNALFKHYANDCPYAIGNVLEFYD